MATDQWDEAFLAEDNPPAQQPAAPAPVFTSVEAWVTGYLSPIIRRPQKRGFAWCAQWWQHAEAVTRLEALWRSWEALRLDGTTGMSVWWRDHLEPHLSVLTDPDRSPFAACHNGHSEALQPLPVEPAPPGWWGPETDAETS